MIRIKKFFIPDQKESSFKTILGHKTSRSSTLEHFLLALLVKVYMRNRSINFGVKNLRLVNPHRNFIIQKVVKSISTNELDKIISQIGEDEFDEEYINIIVNKTPGKTVKAKKAIKALIRSNDPIELPALPPPAHMPDDTQPRTPEKGEGGLKSTDPTPAVEPLTVEKLQEMMTEYGPKDKMSEKHRKTLSLFGFNIDGRKKKSALETLMEISNLVFNDITELKADMDTKSFTNQKLQNLAPLKSRLKKAGVVRPAEPTKVEKPKSAGGGGARPKVSMATGAGWQKRK
jgi:hypothetical protein